MLSPRSRPRLRSLVAGVMAVTLIAGCGDARSIAPSLSQPAPPSGFRTLGYPGIALQVPSNWLLVGAKAPLIATDSSGPATIALWRYTRAGSPPMGRIELARAEQALVRAAQARDPQLHLIRSGTATIDGEGAVELDTLEQIGSQVRRVRSIHIYLPGDEIVLEEYAPPALFHRFDHLVFSPVRHSVHLLPRTLT